MPWPPPPSGGGGAVSSVAGTAPIKVTPTTGHVEVSWDPTTAVPLDTHKITELAPGLTPGDAVNYTQLVAHGLPTHLINGTHFAYIESPTDPATIFAVGGTPTTPTYFQGTVTQSTPTEWSFHTGILTYALAGIVFQFYLFNGSFYAEIQTTPTNGGRFFVSVAGGISFTVTPTTIHFGTGIGIYVRHATGVWVGTPTSSESYRLPTYTAPGTTGQVITKGSGKASSWETPSIETTIDLTIVGTFFPSTVVRRPVPTEPVIAISDGRVYIGYLSGSTAFGGVGVYGSAVQFISTANEAIGYIEAYPEYMRISATYDTIGIGFILTTGTIYVRALNGIYALPASSATPGAIMQMGPGTQAEWVERGALAAFTFAFTTTTGDHTIYTWTNTTNGLVFIYQVIIGKTTVINPTWDAYLELTTVEVALVSGTKPTSATLTALIGPGKTVKLWAHNVTALASGHYQSA